MKPTREDIAFARKHRRAQAKRRGRVGSIVGLRVRDLELVFADRYGAALPDDDAGRDDLLVMAHHLARYASGSSFERIHAWAASWAPWCDADELDPLCDRVLAKSIRWRADTLGQRLGLTDADRTRLGITTIGAVDCTAEERAVRRREGKRLDREARRRAAGINPRPAKVETLQHRAPWRAIGISRSAWFRRQQRDRATAALAA
jgi:hypothetical protein